MHHIRNHAIKIVTEYDATITYAHLCLDFHILEIGLQSTKLYKLVCGMSEDEIGRVTFQEASWRA